MTRLLIVDDNPQSLYLLQVLLSTNGFELELASNGAEALEQARRTPPDMIISDILMPVMDGFALCRACKQDERLKEIPFIFYTATYTDPKDEDFALSLGAERFIVKPVEPDKFLALLRETIETHATGKLVAPREPIAGEAEYYKQYNAVLIRKLEDKALQLEAANRALELDIAERKRVEEALRVSVTKYQVLFESFPLGITIADKAGHILETNKEAERLLGLTREEHTRRQIDGAEWHIIRLDGSPMPPTEYASVRALRENRLIENVEMGIVNEAGQVTWISVTAAPVPLEGYGVAIAYGDITEHRRAEEALRESEKKYRGLVEQSLIGIGLSRGNQVIFANPTLLRIFGYDDLEEFANIPLLDHVSPASRDQIATRLRRAAQGEPLPADFQYDILCKDGKTKTLSAATTRITLGGEVYSQTVFQDITERNRVEETLRESEDRYRDLVENSHDLICTHDLQGQILSANPAATKLLGIAPDALVKMNLRDILAPEVRDQLAEYLDTIQREGAASGLMLVQTSTGEKRLWEYNNTLRTQDVTAPVVRGMARDITERRHAEAALRESQARYRALVEQIPAVVYLDAANETSSAIYTSPQVQAMLGYSPEEWTTDLELWTKLLHPDDRERVLAEHARTNATGDPFKLEYRLVARDGRVVWIRDEAMLVRDSASRPLCWQGIMLDITERKRVEETLRESEEKYRNLVERANDGITIVQDGLIQFANVRLVEMWGGSVAEVMGTSFTDYIDPDELPKIAERYRRRMAGESVTPTYETVLKRRNGEKIYVELNAGAVTYQGKLADLVIIRDITERKQAEEALRKRERDFSTLVENAADMIVRFDTDLRHMYCNAAVERQLGVPRSTFLSKTPLEAGGPREQAEFEIHSLRHVLETGEESEVEQSYPTPMGLKHFQTRIVAERDAAGQVESLLAITRDITQGKRAEEALRQAKDYAENLIQTANVIFVQLNVRGEVVRINEAAEQITGYRQAELGGKNWFETLAPKDRYPHVWGEFAHITERGNLPRDFENPILTRSGEERYIVWRNSILREGDGIVGSLSFGIDITQRKRAEAEIQRHARHLATLHEIDRALTSTLDLDQVLSTLLEQLQRATDAEAASVALMEPPPHSSSVQDRDGQNGELVFRHALGGAGPDVIGWRLQPSQGIAGWVAQHKLSVLVPDAAADPRFYAEVDRRTGFTTRELVCVPLILRGAVTGVIELVNKRQGGYGEDEVQLLESVAAQAAIALENARLFEAERAGRQWLEILYRIGQAINSTLDAGAILDRLTDEAMRATHATHGSALIALPNLGCFERRSLRGYSREQTEKAHSIPLPLTRGVNGRAYQTQRIAYLSDVQTDQDYFPLILETRSELAVPILRGGQVMGNLDLQSPNLDAFRDVDLGFLQALTDQVAVALENARLFEALEEERTSLAKRVEDRTAELNIANAELRQAARAKDEFLASMSHELRTPLNAILGLSEALQEQVFGPLNEKQLRYLHTIEESGQHLLALINDILDLAKVEAGKIELQLGPVIVESVCQSSLQFIKEAALKKQITVSSTLDHRVVTLQGDERRLKQILVNLLSNAVKFTPEGGSVGLDVAGDVDRQRVHFVVWDTGIGITQEDIGRLFKPFVQLDSSLSRQYPGTGLGLSLVKRLAELHGGSVSVESDGVPGQGSRFTISLPWKEASGKRQEAESEMPEVPLAARHAPRAFCILLAEDDEVTLTAMSDYLSSKGYRVIVARNGHEVIQRAREDTPDAIVMDIQMPEMDGLEAIRGIRADPAPGVATIPIIALTAMAMSGDRERCLEAGANEYLSKPASLKELVDAIAVQLAKGDSSYHHNNSQ